MTRAAKIVWFIGLAIFIGWLTHKAFGQTFQRSLPFLAKPIATATGPWLPTNISPAYRWWVFNDLETNVAATNWVDRIHGAPLRPYVTGPYVAPINTTTGLYFSGLSGMSNAPVLDGVSNSPCWLVPPFNPGTSTLAIVVTVRTPATFGYTFQGANFCDYSGGYGLFAWTDKTWKFNGSGGLAVLAQYIENQRMDLIGIFSNIDYVTWYTNGILSSTVDTGNPMNNSWLGSVSFKGEIWECLVASNVWDSVGISNFHWYATNTYGFTP